MNVITLESTASVDRLLTQQTRYKYFLFFFKFAQNEAHYYAYTVLLNNDL